MRLGILTLTFHLEGCTSLKEKRQRLSGLTDRFGRYKHIAACESDRQDQLHSGQWSFACIGDPAVVDKTLAEVEEHAKLKLDAVIIERHRETL